MVRALGEGYDTGAERLKVPPHSVEAEQSLLGGLMLNKAAWDKVADVITSDDFYRNDIRSSSRQSPNSWKTASPATS